MPNSKPQPTAAARPAPERHATAPPPEAAPAEPPAAAQGALATALVWALASGGVAWSRIAALALLGLLGLVGAIAWDQRVFFVTVWTEREVAADSRLTKEAAQQVLPMLLRRTNAVAATVWQLDFPTNTRRLVLATSSRGRTLLDGIDVMPIFRTSTPISNASVVAQLFAGQVPCQVINDGHAVDVNVLRNTVGAQVWCVGAINSVAGELKGAVAVYFAHEPNANEREVIAVALRQAAFDIVRR